MLKIKYIVALFILILITTVIIDFIRIASYDSFPRRPDSKIDLQQDNIYHELINGSQNIDWKRLDGTLEYIKSEYDCSDFRLVNLIRIIYEFEDHIPDSAMSKIEKVLFDFRYWWGDPGENSMCYWTENHQILFASAEYLIGQKYPDVVFHNSGLTGEKHRDRARKRALDWLEMRWKFGFSEFNSGVYYKEDVAALINLIDLAEDEELVKKSMIIMDLLFFDVAMQNINTMFVSASNRAYYGNRVGGSGLNLGGVTNYYWGNGKKIKAQMMYGMITTKRYSLPEVLKDIGKDSSSVVIRQSHGLDIPELWTEGYYGEDERSMMMQLCLGAFSNPDIVRNSLAFVRKNRMFSNEFLTDFQILDFTLFRLLHLEPLLTRLIDPQSNGVAMQRGNVYTYKTADYTLYTTQAYHPGTYGDQQHVSGMNISNSFSIFHNHPAIEKDKKRQSPNYWVGYGHLPHAVQDSNVSLAIYDIPANKGLMEADLLPYTHAYFPSEKFDSALVRDNYAFGKIGKTYCALIGRNRLSYRENATDDLIQQGKQVFWITEAGSESEDQSFNRFCQRIMQNEVLFDPNTLVLIYVSKRKSYELKYGADFRLNGINVDVNYPRYDSKYCKAKRKPETVTITHNKKSLYLDFYNMNRQFR